MSNWILSGFVFIAGLTASIASFASENVFECIVGGEHLAIQKMYDGALLGSLRLLNLSSPANAQYRFVGVRCENFQTGYKCMELNSDDSFYVAFAFERDGQNIVTINLGVDGGNDNYLKTLYCQ